MTNRRVVIGVLVIAAAIAGGWWWEAHRGGATTATPTVTQPQPGSGSSAAVTSAPATAVTGPAAATVTVTDARGPIADASVRFAPDDGDVIVVKTGADGIARASDLAPGSWQISASASGHEPAALAPQELISGQTAKLAIVLPAGGKNLSGLVSDATGGPVAGARIDAARLDGAMKPGDAVASTTTGADGRYALSVAEGVHLVAASSPDYAAQSRHVEVGPAGATADFQLVPGGAIEGVVRDAQTKAVVVGAIVQGRRDGGGEIALAEGGARTTKSGPDGRFRLSGLRPGSYELGARAELRSSKTPTIIGLGVAEQVTDVEVLVTAGPVVRGVVLDEARRPVPNMAVSASGAGRDAETKTDARGAFAMSGLPAGRYAVMIDDDAYVRDGVTQFDVADQDVSGVEVHVRASAMIVGHVEPRQPCEVAHEIDGGAVTELGLPKLVAPVTTGADGSFRLGPATPGAARLVARCSGGDQGALAITIAAGMAEVTLPVTPGASIAGRVVDGAGKPVAGVTVMGSRRTETQATMVVNGMVTSGVQTLTTSTGAFVLHALEPGTYTLHVLDRGKPVRLRGKAVEIALAATDKKTGVELAIDRPDGVIEGVVTTADGKPLADAWVSVHQDLEALLDGVTDRSESGGSSRFLVQTDDGSDAQGFAPVLTDAQGRFAITNLPHARYEVIAEAQAGALRGRLPNITPDAKVTIRATGVTSLSGTVHGASGATPLFTVELIGPTTATRTFTDGTFRIARVDPGAYTVRVTARTGNAETKVTVLPGQPATVDLALLANAILVGKLVDPAGKPLAGTGVALVPDNGDGRIQLSLEGPPPTSGPDGSFRLEAKAGKMALLALTQPRPFAKLGLVLESGKTLDLGVVTVDPAAPPK